MPQKLVKLDIDKKWWCFRWKSWKHITFESTEVISVCVWNFEKLKKNLPINPMFILFPSFLIVALHGMALPTKAVSLFKGQESHGQGLLMLLPSTWSSDGCFYLHLSSADMAATIKNGKNSPRLIQVTLACLNELRLCSFNGMLLHQHAFSVLQTHLGDVFVILNLVLVKQDRKLSGSRLVKSFVGTESLKKVEQSLADLKSKTSPFFKVKWTLSFTTRFKRNPGLINSHGVSIGVLYWLYQIHLLSNIWADFPTLGYASDFGSYKLIPNQIGTLTIDSRPSFSKKNMDPNWMHFLHVESRRKFVPVGKESHFSRQSLPLEDLDKTLQCWFNQLFLVHDRFLPFFLTPKWKRRLFNLWDVFKPALKGKLATRSAFVYWRNNEPTSNTWSLRLQQVLLILGYKITRYARWEMIAPWFLSHSWMVVS